MSPAVSGIFDVSVALRSVYLRKVHSLFVWRVDKAGASETVLCSCGLKNSNEFDNLTCDTVLVTHCFSTGAILFVGTKQIFSII